MAENFFKDRAEKLGMSQRDIAESLPVRPDGRTYTPAAVGLWLRGETLPPIELADDLARILQLTRDRVLKEIHAIAVSKREEKSDPAAAAK